MKSIIEIKSRLTTEIEQCFVKQCKNPHSHYYLYYTQSSNQHNSGLTFFEEYPSNPNFKLVTPQAFLKGATKEQNFSFFLQLLNTLPLIDP